MWYGYAIVATCWSIFLLLSTIGFCSLSSFGSVVVLFFLLIMRGAICAAMVILFLRSLLVDRVVRLLLRRSAVVVAANLPIDHRTRVDVWCHRNRAVAAELLRQFTRLLGAVTCKALTRRSLRVRVQTPEV
jgi:hypothetical protein